MTTMLQFVEPSQIENLYPLTITRPAADLRCGILTIAEKWMRDLGIEPEHTGFLAREHLNHPQSRFNAVRTTESSSTIIQIHGAIIPNPLLIALTKGLKPGEALSHNNEIIVSCITTESNDISNSINYTDSFDSIDRPYHIFALNGKEIIQDFARITGGRASNSLSSNDGPIYIGKNAEIMEGSLVRGPFAMCEGAVLKMGTKVYSATTLGPYCVAGGEISNVVFWGYSNKGHDGFLGNAVLGEWCNIGADTNASNLKNTYDEVKVWNYSSGRFEKSGQQFCGLIMGDHSKCGINTMFNTGTVVGVGCNLFGAGFPRQFVPDFSWGGAQGFVTHKLDAVHKTAALVLPRRKREYGDFEKQVMEYAFTITAPLRGDE